MNWNLKKSTRLSQVCLVILAGVMAAMDLFGLRLRDFLLHKLWGLDGPYDGLFLLLTLYVGSVFVWVLLAALWRLLSQLNRGEVFTERNVTLLRISSWCCACGGVVALVSGAYYLPFVLIGVAACFVALIIRIVKNVFQQAIAMKDELDFTI